MEQLQQDLNVLLWAAPVLALFALGIIGNHYRALKRKQPPRHHASKRSPLKTA
jgi:cytochrome c-type biogenesis protein CcmH/NrfF